MKRYRIKSNKLIIVEGNDDMEVFKSLINKLEFEDIEVHPYNIERERLGALTNFIGAIKQQKNFTDLQIIGIVLDADNSAADKISIINGVLQYHNLNTPPGPNQLSIDGDPFVCYLILPPNAQQGMLEHILYQSISGEPVVECIEELFNCFEDTIMPENFPTILIKAKAKVYLASRKIIVPHVGIAAGKDYWNFDHQIFDELKQFLNIINQI